MPKIAIEGRPATREALSPQMRTSSISNMIFLHFSLLLWFIFVLLDPDPADQIIADPDPQHRLQHAYY
jgi:hypothetical protein